jgi:hypothetical protein
MRGYEQATLPPEVTLPEFGTASDGEWETDEAQRRARLRKQRSLRRQALARIFGLIMGGPLHAPAIPPPQPVVVTEDQRRRGGSGGSGGSGGESEAERAVIRAHRAEGRLMEHLGRLATRTRDEAEAEALVGALVPLAATLVPSARPALMRATPGLVAGLSGAARVLRAHPATRPLVRRLPTVARRTALVLGRRAAQGRPAPPEVALGALARQAMRVLGAGGPEQAAGSFETGPPPPARPTIVVAAGHPARAEVDRRTAGTGGIHTIDVDVGSRREQVVTITGQVLRQIPRRGLENTLRAPEQVPSLRGRGYDRAHLWGRQFGDEAAAGVMYAPGAFNTGPQRVLEDTVKGMRQRLRPGERLMLRARATSFPSYPFVSWSPLRRAEYVFRILAPDGTVVHRTSLRFDIGAPADPKVSVQVFG